MFGKKTPASRDLEHGPEAVSIPAKQGVTRADEQPSTPNTPASPSLQQTLLSPETDPAQGQPNEPVPYDSAKWDFSLWDALQVALGFAHTFFTFYVTLAFLIGIAGEPAWIEQLKQAVIWSGIAAGIVALNGIHNALAKRNIYYKLLQHKVVIDFQQKEPWGAPLRCLNNTKLKACPPECTRVTSFFLLWLAVGSVIVGLGLFCYKWKVYDDNKGLTGFRERWGGGPWSFLAGALGAGLTAWSLLSIYRGLESFYQQLLPFNVLMSSSEADHNNAGSIKQWVSGCVVVCEDDFKKLARRTMWDTYQREEAYRAQLQSLGWVSWKWTYDWFLFSSLCKNDYDNLDMKDQPKWWERALGCITCGVLGKRKESTITTVFFILFMLLTIAITAGILDTAGTGSTAGCPDGQVMYCTAPNCAPPVCPSIFAAPAPAPAPEFS